MLMLRQPRADGTGEAASGPAHGFPSAAFPSAPYPRTALSVTMGPSTVAGWVFDAWMESCMAKATHRYPRFGERIAPYTLREFLREPLPADIGRIHGGADLKLCDLDATVWKRFPPEVVARLAQAVLDHISAAHVRKGFQLRHFPRPAPGTRLAALGLEGRTVRCLAREGLADHVERLGDWTLGQIMAIRSFGPRCLVDLLCALESSGPPSRASGTAAAGPRARLSEEVSAAARRLADLPDAEAAYAEDPRFLRVQAIDGEAKTAKNLAERLLARTQDPPDPAYVAEEVRRLTERIERLGQGTIEEELIGFFASNAPARNAEILVGYYGWRDGRQHTLTEIGQRFGITRERIRQVCAKLTRKPRGLGTILAPVMDQALARIHARLPAPANQIEAELRRSGLTAIGMSLENVAAGAKLLGRTADFRVVQIVPGQAGSPRLAARAAQVAAVPAMVDAAKKHVYFHGLAMLDEIQEVVAQKLPNVGRELVARTLPLVEGFAWLDERSGWFRIEGIGKHGLPKTIDKVLAVAQEVTVAELRAALARNRRLWKAPPPEHVLLAFCRSMPDIQIHGRRIRSDPPRDWRKALIGVERKLVGVLREHGPVMERGEMEDLCVAAGMNRFSFHAFVSWSPVIIQLGHSVYGLLGTRIPRRKLETLANARRAGRTTRRVLAGHGWTDDGKVWLSYRLSKAASTYAVITVPAALKERVRGRFTLNGPDGQLIGTLATKDGRAWGLGAFLRQQGARIDDTVRLTLDLGQRTATVTWRAEDAARAVDGHPRKDTE